MWVSRQLHRVINRLSERLGNIVALGVAKMKHTRGKGKAVIQKLALIGSQRSIAVSHQKFPNGCMSTTSSQSILASQSTGTTD